MIYILVVLILFEKNDITKNNSTPYNNTKNITIPYKIINNNNSTPYNNTTNNNPFSASKNSSSSSSGLFIGIIIYGVV